MTIVEQIMSNYKNNVTTQEAYTLVMDLYFNDPHSFMQINNMIKVDLNLKNYIRNLVLQYRPQQPNIIVYE